MSVRVSAIILIVFIIPLCSYAQDSKFIFFKKANRFFKQYISDGKVDYLRIQTERNRLNELIRLIAEADMADVSPQYQQAFYINAYSILLIKNVVEKYPVWFPLEDKGFFSQDLHVVARDTLTLNEIEEIRLIKAYKDIRFLFALPSASLGSVPMAQRAYKPHRLNKQLEKRIKNVANDYAFVRVFNKSSRILLEESLKKSLKNFDSQAVLFLLNQYRKIALPESYNIDFYPSNRKLNVKYKNGI